MTYRRLLFALLAGLLATPAAQAATSAPVFTKPISLVIPFSPGGSTDPVGRIIAPYLGKELGQSVVVENKPGAAGAIGAAHVARAAPDGHTILLNTGVVAVHPNTLKNPGYDVRTDLIPVTQLAAGPYTLIVNPKLPVKSVQELVAYGKAHPGKLFYGTSGTGGSLHLLTEFFKQETGLDMMHVPYKGNGPVVTALVGGDIQLAFDTIPGSKALAEDGRVRILAVTSLKRNALLPDVPTMDESGFPGFQAETWTGIFLPKGADAAIVKRYNEALVKVLQIKDVQDSLAQIGYVVVGNSPEAFKKQIDGEIDRWAVTVEQAKLTKE
ncbi:Bug family tripartite tricarboxylate transporter substrate binding protein [Bordetella petrii]|uniref:Bug family tripartite tricarboxylate transporter substrate binding protein n=1 Tax=Bordetella petrii TaxID=94624 RepID=UPI001E5FCF2F|nr:tripartite tricarboxylate transporter substrate binding protein [Bordetella petrii]MCD0503805.1 tripartite tricarboxylate transporter substrate binding protein [Bordetella petrii]